LNTPANSRAAERSHLGRKGTVRDGAKGLAAARAERACAVILLASG
jgi:hypothetical protein